jgi:hypothetical protein
MREYKNVRVLGEGEVIGQRTLGHGGSFVNFRANIELLHISEALDRFPNELGGYDGPIWRLQDGYGEAGYVPPQGWDWSGIRDSSALAIQAMVDVAREYLTDDDLNRIIGF